jgi:hypothetical protein
MKNLNITFEDKDFERISKEKEKSGLSWETFIMQIIGIKIKKIDKEDENN